MQNFERSRERGYQNRASATKGGQLSKSWSFCDNVIIEYPQTTFRNKKRICFNQICLTKTRNQPKRPKASRNDPRKIAKRPETTENCEIGEIRNFPLVFVFRISSPNAQIQAFWAEKYQLSNLLRKFSGQPISKVLISNLAFVFQNFEPKCLILAILGQKNVNFLILTKFPLRRFSKVLISNPTFVFQNFESKCPILGILG